MRAVPKLSIVIPVYNEERRLLNNLDKIISFFNRRKDSYEIILIDDGSTDSTAKICEKYSIAHEDIHLFQHGRNMGKGAAVRTGMLKARGKIVLMTDCDLSTPIEEIESLEEYIRHYDIVIGSRRLKEKKLKKMPEKYRTILGDIYYELLRMILLPSVKDTNCGFKLFSKKVIKPVFSRSRINRWGYDAEVLFIAHKLGFTIKEIPVFWTHYPGSKVKIFNAVANTLKELFEIKINNALGRYD